MRGVRARGAIELAEVLGLFDAAQLTLQAVYGDGKLLAHGGRGGGLSVRVRKHGDGARALGELGDGCAQVLRLGQPDTRDGVLDGQRVGEVVDVFARAADVDELGDAIQTEAGERCANVQLDGFHVVARARFDARQVCDGLGGEFGDELSQLIALGVAQGGGAEKAVLGDIEEPLDLDVESCPVEPGF